MQNKSKIADFTEGNVTKQLLIFATPLFLSNLLQIVYNMVDMIIVGRKLGSAGISAVSIGGDVTNFLTFVGMGFAGAGQVIIAQLIGAGEKRKLGSFIGTMFSCLMGCALLISVGCVFLREQMLELMNTPVEAFDEALGYATVCIIGLIFIYGYNISSAILRGMGDSIRPFIFITMAAVINVVLDIAFVMGMDMGAFGAGLATVISQAISFLCCVWYIWIHRCSYELDLKLEHFIHIDTGLLKKLVKLGTPMAIKFAAVHVSKLFVNSWINSYGVAVSAFAGIANKISSAANLVSNAFNTAGSSMVGQNIGAKTYGRVKEIMLAVFKVTVLVATVLSVLFIFFPEQIYGTFTDDSKVIDIGIKYVPIAILMFYGSAARSGMNALINGSGKTAVNFATAILDGIILRIGLALLFGLGLGMKHYGFWLGDALAGFTPFFLGIIFYFSGSWKVEKE